MAKVAPRYVPRHAAAAPPPPPATHPAPADPGRLVAAASAEVAAAVEALSNPGARNILGRAWATASAGLTAANADARLSGFAARVARSPQVTEAERARLADAVSVLRAVL